jgi:RNA polymerase sigma-70 factor (ECF subfamily)
MPIVSETAQESASQSAVERREEFLSLLRAHKHQVFNFIFCILQNMHDTEDVFQQTALALWENYDEFTPGSNFGAWATRIARHRVAQFIRSRQRNRHHYFTDELIARLAECPFPSQEAQEAQLQALASCRKKLSPPDQRLLLLCYGGAESIRDAARQLGRPAETVYCSLTRIRSRLRQCIERSISREARS